MQLFREEVNIKAFTIDTTATRDTPSVPAILSETISKYVKKRLEEKEFKMFINMYFEDFGSPKDQQSCVCPIPGCPFKSKALYLLVKGKTRMNINALNNERNLPSPSP